MSRPDAANWMEAWDTEMGNLKDAWYFCDHSSVPESAKPIARVQSVFTVKMNADGTFDRYKVRHCLDCSRMTKDQVGETYQHVAEMDTTHFMCATAAQFDLCLMQTDIEAAFLEGDDPSVMYCYPPDGERAPMGTDGRRMVNGHPMVTTEIGTN